MMEVIIDWEALSELRSTPGWASFVAMLQEAKAMRIDGAPYVMTTERELWEMKGWLEAIDTILDAPNLAREMIEDADRSEMG